MLRLTDHAKRELRRRRIACVRVAAATEEAAPGVMLDFYADGRVIGIEVPGVRQRMRPAQAAAPARSAAE